jgi:hypothetical protein
MMVSLSAVERNYAGAHFVNVCGKEQDGATRSIFSDHRSSNTLLLLNGNHMYNRTLIEVSSNVETAIYAQCEALVGV